MLPLQTRFWNRGCTLKELNFYLVIFLATFTSIGLWANFSKCSLLKHIPGVSMLWTSPTVYIIHYISWSPIYADSVITKLTSWPPFRRNCSGQILISVATVDAVLASNTAVSCVVHLLEMGLTWGTVSTPCPWRNVLKNNTNGFVTTPYTSYSWDEELLIKALNENIENITLLTFIFIILRNKPDAFCSTRLYMWRWSAGAGEIVSLSH